MTDDAKQPPTRWGASESEWDHFSQTLGLTEDLLPVVSRIGAEIAPGSKMVQVGKTPSRYAVNSNLAQGISEWTQKHSTVEDIRKWKSEPDYGICIQTRSVRAIDVDITDMQQAILIHQLIKDHFGILPARVRENSSKFLVVITLPGEYTKRVIRTQHGIVEFLATGQQFIAAGTHTSGVKYEWNGGLPKDIPTVTGPVFEAFWEEVEKQFAIAPSKTSKASIKVATLSQAAKNDPVAVKLLSRGDVLAQDLKTGKMDIVCPFEDEHSETTSPSSTSYYPANTGGFKNGHFSCLHGHCLDRPDQEFLDALGFGVLDDFEVLPPPPPTIDFTKLPPAAPVTDGLDYSLCAAVTIDDPGIDPLHRFAFEPASKFASAQQARYIIKGVLPKAELVVLYGASTSGKTFAVLDMACSIARGEPWRRLRTHGGRVAYVVAEGANFFRGRLKAYATHHEIPLESIDLHILGNAPNLLSRTDTADLIDALRQLGPLQVVVIDTLAQTMAGGDENSGQDVGKLLSHCKFIHRHTGATVLLVHHSGKDETKGARGWSGLRAACDAELEVSRNDIYRCIRISKQKDGQDGIEYAFKLKSVPIGMDDDGDIIESCIVDHGDLNAAPVRRSGVKKKPQTENAKLVFAKALDMVGPGGAGLSTGDLIDAVIEQMPFDEHAKGRDLRRRAAMRALDSLVAGKNLVVEEGKIFLPKVED